MSEHEQEKTTSPPEPPPDAERWRQEAESAQRELAVRRALQGIDWFDPEDAYRELAPLAQQDREGHWHVMLPGGRSADGTFEKKRVTPEEAARELAARKPHWVKARVFGGTGAGTGTGGNPGTSAGITYAELLKPQNQNILREYLYDRPEELERLRQAHFKQQ